jgi:hypothetical protein
MRSIFFLILTANLIFFVQHYFFAAKPGSELPGKGLNEREELPNNLFLLSEQSELNMVSNKQASKKVQQKTNPAAQEVRDDKVPLCTMIGPYEQLLHAEYAVEKLAALGADVHVVPLEIKAGESFWVFLNPEVSEREALNRLYELQKKNIESHIISKGELTNGISFGRFSNYEDAEALARSVRSNGYDAQIKIMPKTIHETWVVVNEGFAEKIDSSVWEELLRKEKALEKRQNYCLGVASQ